MFFEKHVFCCINKRPDSNPKGCCSSKDSEKLQIELKTKIKNLKLNKKIRINKSGCLDRCELGPVMVIYPEGVWYSFKNSGKLAVKSGDAVVIPFAAGTFTVNNCVGILSRPPAA